MATQGSWRTPLFTGILLAGLLGCGADTDAETGSPPDRNSGEETAPVREDPCAPETGAVEDPLARMCAVAAAWAGSDAAGRWAEEFHPVDPLVRLPEGGLRDEEDTRAYDDGSFRALAPLPEDPAEGEVTWEEGGSAQLPLRSAAEVYAGLDSGIDDHSADFHALEVTGVEQGEMPVRTGRGPARVPAWLFTVEGYDTPLRHSAIALPEPLAAPVEPLPEDDAILGAGTLGEVSADGRSVTVVWEEGSCAGRDFEVLETAESVVIAASRGEEREDVVCTAVMRTVRQTLELERPLGERAPLDAATGEVLRPVLAPE